MSDPAQSRWRERRRASTIAEIKGLARELLVNGGPEAISLRAISREMGMVPSALYRYYPNLDDLMAALRGDLFEELGQVTAAAKEHPAHAHPTARITAMARAFRSWGLAHREEFGLILGPPVHGTSVDNDGDIDHGTACIGIAFLEEFVELWRLGELIVPVVESVRDPLVPPFGAYIARNEGIEVPVVFAFLSAWTRLYGIIAMEVFGHMGWAVTDPEEFFETELTNFVRQLSQGEPRADAPLSTPTR
jgi:AcrR family transcriptional regulator